MTSLLRGVGFRMGFATIIAFMILVAPGGRPHAGSHVDIVTASKNQNSSGLYGGGTGKTIEDAVIINADNSLVGVAAEYAYVSSKCGRRNVDWTLKLQVHMEKGGRHYDILTVELKSGEVRQYYFDITRFWGKF